MDKKKNTGCRCHSGNIVWPWLMNHCKIILFRFSATRRWRRRARLSEECYQVRPPTLTICDCHDYLLMGFQDLQIKPKWRKNRQDGWNSHIIFIVVDICRRWVNAIKLDDGQAATNNNENSWPVVRSVNDRHICHADKTGYPRELTTRPLTHHRSRTLGICFPDAFASSCRTGWTRLVLPRRPENNNYYNETTHNNIFPSCIPT